MCTIQENLRSILDCLIDVPHDAVNGELVNDRAHSGTSTFAVRDQFGADLDDAVQQSFLLANSQQDGGSHAPLPSATGIGTDDILGGHLHIAVGHCHKVVFGAWMITIIAILLEEQTMKKKKKLKIEVPECDVEKIGCTSETENFFVGMSTTLGDDFSNLGGANERDSLDARRVANTVDDVHSTVDNVDNTIGQTGVLEHLDHLEKGDGHLLARLDDDAVTGGNGDGNGPHRNLFCSWMS